MNLNSYIKKFKSIDQKFFLQIALELIEGIEFIHNRGYFMRDLSMDNVLLTSDNHIKICDFGRAKTVSRDEYR